MQVDFESSFKEGLQRLVSSGRLEKMIDEQITKTVERALSEAFGNFSEFRKELEKKFIEQAGIDLRNVSFVEYQETIRNRIQMILNKNLIAEAEAGAMRIVDSLLEKGPEEITLSQLVERMMQDPDHLDEAKKEGWSRPTVTISLEYRSHWISLDPSPNKQDYQARVRIGMDKDGKIFSLRHRTWGESSSFASMRFIQSLGEWDKTLLNLYAGRTQLILNPDEIEKAEGLEYNHED